MELSKWTGDRGLELGVSEIELKGSLKACQASIKLKFSLKFHWRTKPFKVIYYQKFFE